MKLRISETMDGFFDNDIEMENPGVVDTDRVRDLTMAKLGISPAKATRRPARKLGRVLLIAATVVLALTATALAVYQYGMKDRVVEGHLDSDGTMYVQYSPVGLAPPEETASVEAEVYSLEGGGDGSYFYSSADSSHAEFFALQEWLEYFFSDCEEDYDVLLPYDSPYRDYGIGWEAMAEKLEALAAKYGLRLYENGATVAWLDEFYEVSGLGSFLPLTEAYAEDFGCTGEIYDEGSFHLNAVKTPYSDNEDEMVPINIYRAMKGTFCSFFITGDEPDEYTYETYVTEDGFEVDIALGRRYSMIFAELDNCYVTTFVNGGVEPGQYLTLLDMDDMKYIAESTDYSLLGGKNDDALAERVMEEEKIDDAYTAEQLAKRDAEEAAYYETVESILSEIGRYGITELPEGVIGGEFYNADYTEKAYMPWLPDGMETCGEARVFLSYSGDDFPHIELIYTREWENGNKENSITAAVYENYKADYLANEPEECIDGLKINGGDAFAIVRERSAILIWMNEDADICFSLEAYTNSENTNYSLDDLIAMAESVEKQ